VTSQLSAALRATAEGIYPDEAGTGLIVSGLRLPDPTLLFLSSGAAGQAARTRGGWVGQNLGRGVVGTLA
jgi:hypothetical protein